MHLTNRSRSKLVIAPLLAALALSPTGCGPEAAPVVLTALGAAGTIAFVIHEIQQIEIARLDIELNRLRLKGLRNGMPITVEKILTDEEVNQIRSTGEVEINGTTLPVLLQD